LGPNDYYYWDNFWGVAGLRAATRLAGEFGRAADKGQLSEAAADFEEAIFASIDGIPEVRKRGAVPASPHRRMDAGAVGSLVADYPLQITPPGDARIMRTVEFLMQHCLLSGGFFHDMIHSGINAYLTLCLAQTLLRSDDLRYRRLIDAVADLASSTGQWPEAIHPITGGGCMGDGQHGWAAAEWIMMIRNLFVREEEECLIVGSGIFPEWVEADEGISFGPTLTPYGPVTVETSKTAEGRLLRVDARWRGDMPAVEVRVPGYQAVPRRDAERAYRLTPLRNSGFEN
jgi:hypothetical protein